MKNSQKIIPFIIITFFISIIFSVQGCTHPSLKKTNGIPHETFKLNNQLARGINLGNALEAPREGDWGVVLQADYFTRIAKAGFQTVRIPIRWSAHTGDVPAYKIDPDFFNRVDWAIHLPLASCSYSSLPRIKIAGRLCKSGLSFIHS